MKWALFPYTRFSEFAAQWDQLNLENGASPILSSEFMRHLIAVFAEGDELLAVLDGKEAPAAMAIVRRVKAGAWATFQPSQAPIGAWLQRPGEDLETAAESLRRALPGPVLVFSITQQDPEILPRPVNSRNLSTLDYIETAKVEVRGSFGDYWSARSKNLRQNLRRQRNRLAREESEVYLEVITDPSSVDDCIAAYAELESAGWKKTTNTAIEADNAQGEFYTRLLTTFLCRNSGCIYQYYYDDKLVATDLCIADTRQIIILKTTYDESIHTSSPAMLMRQEAFQAIFDTGAYQRIEFYGKVMDWHRKWSSDIRTMYHVNISPGWVNWVRNRRRS